MKYQASLLMIGADVISKKLINSIATIILVACNSDKKYDIRNQSFEPSILTSKAGAALAFRVTLDKALCDYGTIKLRKIQEGVIDKDHVETLAVTKTNYVFVGMSNDMKKPLNIFHPLTIESAAKNLSYNDIKGAFNSIALGDYILTEVRCEMKDGYKAIVGETRLSTFLKNEIQQDPRPLLGSNFIHINTGEMIDMGVLNLTPIDNHIFRNKKVMVVGVKASGLLQNTIAQRFADLNGRIRFTTMSFDPTIMQQYIQKAL